MAQAKLLDVAIREFGRQGRDGTSTRSIAAAAGVAMSAITYHFGGKDGLYLAAADHIVALMTDDMGPTVTAEMFVGDGDADSARAGIHRIVSRFIDKMAGDAFADEALFIAREQMNPTEAFDRLYDGPMGAMLATVIRLICAATGARDEHAARITAMTFLGQVVALRGSRAMYLRLLETDSFSDTDRAAIRQRIAANIDAILDRMTAEAKGQA